jgi:hypothetical protein
MLVENRDAKERADLDALLAAPLEAAAAPAGALRRGATFSKVGRSVVVR